MGKIFTKPYEAWYRLDKKFIHHCRDIQCAWQRATKGYCYRDLWNIDFWFVNIMPKMLKDFEKITCGFPMGMTREEWSDILNEMIETFEKSDEFNKIYDNALFSDILAKDEYITMYMEKGLNLFVKYFRDLWD